MFGEKAPEKGEAARDKCRKGSKIKGANRGQFWGGNQKGVLNQGEILQKFKGAQEKL